MVYLIETKFDDLFFTNNFCTLLSKNSSIYERFDLVTQIMKINNNKKLRNSGKIKKADF